MRATAGSEAPPQGFRAGTLGLAESESAFRLSAEAGWNQTVADWRFMLGHGEGLGLRDEGGALAATTLVLPFAAAPPAPAIGWISMVLVTEPARGRGLATWMMRWALDRLAALGRVALLDATPAGREVYARLGFVDGPPLRRLARPALPPPAARDPAVRRMTASDLPHLVALDVAAFGADRGAVLRLLFDLAPELAFVAEAGGRPRGFVLGRPGRIAPELGPIVAPDDGVAIALLRAGLASLAAGPVLLDVLGERPLFAAALAELGFVPQRSFVRMARGAAPGRSALAFAAAGPELG